VLSYVSYFYILNSEKAGEGGKGVTVNVLTPRPRTVNLRFGNE
jgi:hypothetical protein